MTPSSDSSDTYTSTVQSSPPLLMLHSRLTLVFKLFIPCLAISYLLPLPSHHRPLLLAVLLRFLPSLPPDSLRVLQCNAGSLRARSTELLLFLLSHPVVSSVLATLSSSPSFLLPQTLWQIWQELSSLSSCSIRLQWVPRHSFLPGHDAADELARRGVLLAPSAIPCGLPLISRIHSCLFLD